MSDLDKATALGGIALDVVHAGGKTERVQVKQLPMRDFQAFVESNGNLARKAELLCGRPEPWADSLTPESVLTIVRKGDEVNPGFFDLWSYMIEAKAKMLKQAGAE